MVRRQVLPISVATSSHAAPNPTAAVCSAVAKDLTAASAIKSSSSSRSVCGRTYKSLLRESHSSPAEPRSTYGYKEMAPRSGRSPFLAGAPMPRDESTLVLGVISSCIAVIDGLKKPLDLAQDDGELPQTFHAVGAQLPLILKTLLNIESKSQSASNAECAPVLRVATRCEENAVALQNVLQEVMTGEDDKRLQRYYKHIKALGKGHRVELLAQQILKQLQDFQAHPAFARIASADDLQEAISGLENTEDENDDSYSTFGSGSINVARDSSTQHNHNYTGRFESKGTMHIGPGTI